MKNEVDDSDDTNVYNLISKLCEEKLFVSTEKYNIERLNDLIRRKSHEVIKAVWISSKQRLILHREATSQNYQKIDTLLNSNFVEAKNVLGFQTSVKVGTLLQVLRTEPEQLAKWLAKGEQTLEDNALYLEVLQTIVNGLYACFIFSEDLKYMLRLLYELAKIQLLKSDNPRRILKQRTGTFSYLYFLFHEVLQPAKFFLVATFEIPILQLMAHTEYYLDVDPNKTTMRYKQDDISLHMFKDEIEYRNEVITKLVEFTNCFISSLLENAYSFPKSIAWIVNHVSKIVEKAYGSKEASAVTTELIFTMYICPVIVNPEQYGICDSQINDITRHNLIQIGQLLQCLAFNKSEAIDPKLKDIFNLLSKDSMSNFIQLILSDLEDTTHPPVEYTPNISRDILILGEQELNNLIVFFQRVQNGLLENDNYEKSSLLGVSIEEHLSSLTLASSRDNSPKSNRPYGNDFNDFILKKSQFFALGTKNHVSRSSNDVDMKNSTNTALVFPLDINDSAPIGLLPEEKILVMIDSTKNDTMFGNGPLQNDVNLQENGNNNEDIKPQYPNYVDEGSIGNTSDNLEVISEAASNHSVASSLELENEDQNDNLSDMVSANVSGRGTPNISGRDTPSSQVNENEARPADIAQPQQQISTQIRSEIDDKFCKFEIKKLLEGDETISIISETWSTDVLASDNETIDAGDSRLDRQSIQLVDQAIHEVPIGNILDISETQSESAWSTDVMTSDTERLTEVDNDDAASVAQSDDTNSVARSDDTRSETDENQPGARRLSTSSNSYINNIPNNSPSYANMPSPYGFQEYRKLDRSNGKVYNSERLTAQTDSNANNLIIKSLTLSDNQQIAHNSMSYSEQSEIKTCTYNSRTSYISTSTTTRVQNTKIKDMDTSNMAGPSGIKRLTNMESESNSFLKQNRISNKYEDRPNEILLSNLSINSSSSGSSSNSFENNKTSHNENSEQWESKQWLNSSGSSLNVTLTPSESTSELSVLSSNHFKNSNILAKKSATMLPTRSSKPSISTGAIPKSISFDMSVDKGLDDEQRSKRDTFFGKLRKGFRNRRGKTFRNQDDYRSEIEDYSTTNNNMHLDSPVRLGNNTEASDDILAKYRTKPFVESSPIKENCDVNKSPKVRNDSTSNNFDINNSFNDIKKKLRLVLSNTSEIPHFIKTTRITIKNKIETILRLELGKARKLRDWSNVARISEAIRCINLLNDKKCLKLLQSMKEDITQRSTYTQYLIRSRQELLFSELYLDSLIQQISNEKQQSEEYLATICIQEFLTEQENEIVLFCEEFNQLNLADEKCDCLYKFYHKLHAIMNGSPLWKDVFHNKEQLIKLTLERFIMSKVYKNSIYPNGDGDRDRDRVLQEHISNLSKIITPGHKSLLIHKMFLRECPWQPAQDALRALNACRTPRDKVNCVVHCAKCIMDLLSLSQGRGSTTADDFTPVLVFVIIKVNPDALLSTVQFVNSFYHNQLSGEEEYWWTQFSAAVEYIKTMDYSD